jgi:hypothetical protein
VASPGLQCCNANVPLSFFSCYGSSSPKPEEPPMTEKRQPIEDAHLESSIAVALKLAHFRPSRLTTESDLICAQAARAVMESFQRSGWVVVSDRRILAGVRPKRCRTSAAGAAARIATSTRATHIRPARLRSGQPGARPPFARRRPSDA